ncbi:MAG: hypothetical protein FWH15_09135 [Betaproteobacteria bacterium]|nr:hypothetical protein [Betaproteobacteria bacterium]
MARIALYVHCHCVGKGDGVGGVTRCFEPGAFYFDQGLPVWVVCDFAEQGKAYFVALLPERFAHGYGLVVAFTQGARQLFAQYCGLGFYL